MNVAIFPTGLSFGLTVQCSLSFLNAGEDWLCWLISTPETHSISKRIGERNPKIKVIPQDDFGTELKKLNDNTEFNFLIGPSTREVQLSTISLLFNHSYIPKFWFIEENPNKRAEERFLSTYTDSKIPMLIIEETVLHSCMSIDDLSFIKANDIVWDVKSNRFTYRVKFPTNASHFEKNQIRDFQDKILLIFQEAQERFGVHGVLGNHERLPSEWPVTALDRFQQSGLKGGR